MNDTAFWHRGFRVSRIVVGAMFLSGLVLVAGCFRQSRCGWGDPDRVCDETRDVDGGAPDGSTPDPGPCGGCFPDEVCDIESAECVQCLVDADCDDFDPCTSGESCVDRACTPPDELDQACITQIEAGRSHTCARRGTTAVMCWGNNHHGALGNGESSGRVPSPVQVPDLDGVVQVSAGGFFTCALRSNGSVVCWGTNELGQLGLGPGGPPLSTDPVVVPGLENVVEISAGARHACALLRMGEVWCWGDNAAAQLGDGTIIDRPSPVRVREITDAVEIDAASRGNSSASGQHTCARLRSGKVMCWGANGRRQLGDGTSASSAVPVEFVGVTDAVEVATGTDSTCVRERSGAVTCTGSRGFETFSFLRPISLASGSARCVAEASGPVSCWGTNSSGDVGDGTRDPARTPTPVMDLSNVVELTASGGGHTCARTVTGAVFCWGSNNYGQLGLGEEGEPQLSAARVPAL